MTDEGLLAAEHRARLLIDRQLTGAGWVVQDRRNLNLFAGQGVAVREVIMARGHGRAANSRPLSTWLRPPTGVTVIRFSCALSPDSIHSISVTGTAPVFVVEPKTCAQDKQEYSCNQEPEQHCDPPVAYCPA